MMTSDSRQILDPADCSPISSVVLIGVITWVSLICSACSSAVAGSSHFSSEDVFRSEVAPLLERRCLSCHNAVDRKGGGSLTTQDDLESTGWIEPGHPDQSLLIQVLLPEDDSHPPRMPRDSTPLTRSQIDILRRWISEGAVWSGTEPLQEPVIQDFNWWSFRQIHRPEVPEQAGVNHPIDAFILQKLQEHRLSPSPEADRRTLIRRVTFDLLGLPPTPEEIAAFESDTSPDAWENLIDRLLASPQYGERWARHWLDIVKYADTCGYDKDKLRPNAFPYRDYVIRSFNTDKPYPQFVAEQLAGDVLYPGTPDGIVGLGFVAAGPWDFIGHVEVPESKIDGKVARNLDRDDMVSNALNTFCSVTIQCARCHNHKFDPFTQQHYYSLQSVFAAVDRAERPFDTDPAVEKKRTQLQQQFAAAIEGLKQLNDDLEIAGGDELRSARSEIQRLKPLAEPENKRPEYGYHSQLSSDAASEKWVEVDLGSDQSIRQVILNPCHDEFAGIGSGFGFPVRYRVEVAGENDRSDRGTHWTLIFQSPDHDLPRPSLVPLVHTVTGSDQKPGSAVRYVRVTASKLRSRQNDYNFALAELQVLNDSGQNRAIGCAVEALDSIEAPDRWSSRNLTDGIFPQPRDITAAASLVTAERQEAAILERIHTEERIQRREQLETTKRDVQAELNSLPIGQMVYAASTHFPPQGAFQPTMGKPREIRILHRGQETQPTELVSPGTIPLSETGEWQFPLASDHNEGDRRAALANWVISRDNPLTWRSIVNRVWQYHFGQGIVDSPNDFGRMGQTPSHPELLDWLADEFRDRPSFKSLHRLILTSQTYRQVSLSRSDYEALDAPNRWLWRMNRRRLSAEELRDAVLSVSGRLNLEMGGPGFYLFELEKPEHSPHYEYYKFDPADPKSHRRSIYRFVVRSQPDPFMTTLDCADSSQSTPRRNETLTSLQALSLMNSRFTTTMSRAFAERLRLESEQRDLQVRRGFQIVTGRNPETDELHSLSHYAEQHGLENVCRVLLNLSEFVFVE